MLSDLLIVSLTVTIAVQKTSLRRPIVTTLLVCVRIFRETNRRMLSGFMQLQP